MIFGFLKRRRRRNLRGQTIPPAWRSALSRTLPLFRRLPPEDQAELLRHIQVFLGEKRFEGCGGLELTDEIRLAIAAQACVLLLHRETDYYPQLTTILVYPSSYIVPGERHLEGPIWEEGDQTLLGHATDRLGSIVLAWDAAKKEAANSADGRNLVLHEFAHQLDFENYTTDGAPALATRAEYATWARVMSGEFKALQAADEAGWPTVLDPYGATNPAEFFAVATEAFFERPRELRGRHPELYAALGQYFRQDPARHFVEAAPAD
ncbi:MAG TPA: M90 family metallopeptidase [Chthoniobacterales bacterium]|nr:M90 family metallopeptidase [Chthoniobacterales bacterium]